MQWFSSLHTSLHSDPSPYEVATTEPAMDRYRLELNQEDNPLYAQINFHENSVGHTLLPGSYKCILL